MSNEDIIAELKKINKRLDKLEKVAHKQPSMKEMMKNASLVYEEKVTGKSFRKSDRRSCRC